jgi:hypothetical protein
LPSLLGSSAGRAYLLRVPLFGLTGPIAVDGERYAGVMAPFDFRSDAELAAILNHTLTAWGNERLLPPGHLPVTAEEIGAARDDRLAGAQVRDLRPPSLSVSAARKDHDDKTVER